MRMLYKYPGPHDIHGDKFDYVVVAENQVDKHLSEGWHMTTTEAKDAMTLKPEPVMKKAVKPKKKPRKEKDKNIISPKDLTSEMKFAIANDSDSKMKIARKYNVSVGTVYKIKVGKL